MTEAKEQTMIKQLKLAHDYAMQLVASPDYNADMSLVEFVDHVWKYADAMQAKADQRVKDWRLSNEH